MRIGIKGTISSKGRVYACIICFGAALLLPLLYTIFVMASLIMPNNVTQQWKDSGGVARDVFNVSAANHTTLQGIFGTDILDILSSAGVANLSVDTSTGNITKQGTITPEPPIVPSANGAAGTMFMYQMIVGPHLKLAIIYFNGYKGLAGSAQTLTFPTAFTTRAIAITANVPSVGVQLSASGVGQTCSIQTGFGNATTDGTSVPGATIHGFSFAHCRTAFDGFTVPAGDANTTTEMVFIIGF